MDLNPIAKVVLLDIIIVGTIEMNCMIINYINFLKLIESSCYYCYNVCSNLLNVRNKYIMPYNGIDRINNNLGYSKDNVVSCCKICNRAKDKMSQDDFYRWLAAAHATTCHRRIYI